MNISGAPASSLPRPFPGAVQAGPKASHASGPQLEAPPADAARRQELREVFDRFVGETFYNHMFQAMRKTVGRPAYLHGGRAEEVFQTQLDQLLSARMSAASAESFTGPMFELFQLPRS